MKEEFQIMMLRLLFLLLNNEKKELPSKDQNQPFFSQKKTQFSIPNNLHAIYTNRKQKLN
jgi:hypothetical protein